MRTVITFAFLQINFLAIQTLIFGDSTIKYLWLVCPISIFSFYIFPRLSNYSSPISYLIYAFCFILLVHASVHLFSFNIKLAAAAFLSWGAWIPLALYFYKPKSNKDFNPFIQKLFYSISLIHSVFIILQSQGSIILIKAVTVSTGVERSYGIGYSVSITAIEIGIGLIASLFLIRNTKQHYRKFLLVITITIQMYALILTGMRGPLIFTALMTSIFILKYFYNTIKLEQVILSMGLIGVTTIICFTIFPFIPREYKLFYESSLQTSSVGNSTRIERWHETLSQTTSRFDSIILGIGSGKTNTIPNINKSVSITNESSILKVFLETGLLGTLILTLVVVTTVTIVFRKATRFNPNARDITVGCQFMIIIFECSINDMLNTWIIAFYFWALIGLIQFKVKSSFQGNGTAPTISNNLPLSKPILHG